jgi:hypothetical protein
MNLLVGQLFNSSVIRPGTASALTPNADTRYPQYVPKAGSLGGLREWVDVAGVAARSPSPDRGTRDSTDALADHRTYNAARSRHC